MTDWKPTLYAEDVDQLISDMHHPGFGAVIRAFDTLARILPRRCPRSR